MSAFADRHAGRSRGVDSDRRDLRMDGHVLRGTGAEYGRARGRDFDEHKEVSAALPISDAVRLQLEQLSTSRGKRDARGRSPDHGDLFEKLG